MSYEWAFSHEADDDFDALEHDPTGATLLQAVRRALGRLEVDPGDPRLGTRTFVTENYGHVRATPVGVGTWTVLWTIPEAEPTVLVAIHIGELDL